jgi:CRP-like cAMP-binding protein
MGSDMADRLREHPFATGFCPEDIAHMAAMAREIHFLAGKTIFREGDHSSLFYLLITGRVALKIQAPAGPGRVATLFAGEVLGWPPVTGGTGQQFEARALKEIDALAFDGADMRRACEADHGFGFRISRAVLGAMTGRLQAIRAQFPDVYTAVGDEK